MYNTAEKKIEKLKKLFDRSIFML